MDLEILPRRGDLCFMENNDEHAATAIELLHHVEGLVALGENRANIVAAGNAALLVAYASTDLDERLYSAASWFGDQWPTACALIAVFFAVASLWPQMKSTLLSNKSSASSYYFGCIGDLDEAKFIADFQAANEKVHVEKILRAVHMRSKKAKVKFTLLAVATIATVAQFAPLVGTAFG